METFSTHISFLLRRSAQDSFAPECVECNVPCAEEFTVCSGLPNVAPVEDEDPSAEDGDGGDIASNPAVVVEQCNSFDLDAVDTWHNGKRPRLSCLSCALLKLLFCTDTHT